MKARDWLVERGLAKPSRGKFSTDAHAALVKALGEGVKFSDYPKNPVSVTTDAGTVTVSRPDPGDSAYRLPSDFRFPISEYIAREVVGGKKHGLAEVCSTCRISLCDHRCDSPVIYGNVAVTIERGSLV